MLGSIPSWGLGVGYQADKLQGIEQKYDALKASTEILFKALLTGLKNGGDQLNQVKKFLAHQYPKSKPEELQKAAENISTVIALAKGIDSDIAAQLIGEWYADSWRNNAIRGLNKNFKISGGAIGIQFLSGFYPVVSLSAKFTRYHNEGIGDAASSKAHQRQSIEYGVGNTTPETLQASDFDLITKQLQTAGILNENEKLTLEKSDDGDEFVQLPRTLLQKSGLKIAVHENLKGYITTDKEAKYLFLPKETAYRFLEVKMRTGKSYLLNVGGTDNQDGKMTTLTDANLETFLGDKELKLEKMAQAAQTMLEKVRNQDSAFKNLKLEVGRYGEMTFSNGGAQLELSSEGKGLWIQDGGKFTLSKLADGTLQLEKTEDTPGEGLEFSFDEGQTQNFEIKHQKSALLQSLSDPKSELVIALSKLDDQHLTALNSFLQNTKATENDYAQASREFLAILPDQELFKDLRAFLENTLVNWDKVSYQGEETYQKVAADIFNKFKAEKYIILDRLKAIFATERKITDLRSLQNIVAMRNNAYQQLSGPNGKTLAQLGITIDSTQFAQQLENIDHQLDPQLVGFTAFYRKGTQEGRGMSLTALGETKVLGGRVQELDSAQEQAARERFFGKEGEAHASGNLEKYPVQLQFLRDQVKKMAEKEAALSNAQVDDLLK